MIVLDKVPVFVGQREGVIVSHSSMVRGDGVLKGSRFDPFDLPLRFIDGNCDGIMKITRMPMFTKSRSVPTRTPKVRPCSEFLGNS